MASKGPLSRLGWPPCVAIFGLVACEHGEPPGTELADKPGPITVGRPLELTSVAEPVASAGIGTPNDNLPFAPTEQKLGSIAWRTWIYTDTGPARTRYGYLRAGAVVDRRGPEIRNDGCEGGWYRINPRGFVCIGKGATLDLDHPILRTSRVRAARGGSLPYTYALSRENAPHLYYRLPSRKDMEAAEGGYRVRAAEWLARARARGAAAWIAERPPADLIGLHALEHPYGITRGLHVGAHAGKANPESGFALLGGFEWEERAMALTTELDVIALDRTELVTPSRFVGVALGPDEDLPAAIVDAAWVTRYERDATGRMRANGSFEKRTVLALSGETQDSGSGRYYETRDGSWVQRFGLTWIEPRESYPSVATGTRKWIDVSIRRQTLIAYVGKKAEYVTLVSTGLGGLGDPEEVPATIQGTFMIYEKDVTSTMDGEEDVTDSFELHDVPFVQYFHKGFALHAAYWHDEFGRARSHGCVNLSPQDAAWLFEWTDPHVPADWHAVINKERGTVVQVHP
jgi:hypothetical protein